MRQHLVPAGNNECSMPIYHGKCTGVYQIFNLRERERVPEKSWCAVASLAAETLMLSGNTQLKKEPLKEKIG
jgi:hypothetical protein